MFTEFISSSKIKYIIFLLIVLSIGCAQKANNTPEEIIIKSGNNQSSAPNTIIQESLVVEVLSAVKPGILGGKGNKYPVAGCLVKFSVDKDCVGAEIIGNNIIVTDAGGIAKVQLKLGSMFGDCYITAQIETPKGPKKVTFRVISGLVASGNNQEVSSNSLCAEPISLTVYSSEGKTVANIPVHFRLEGSVDKDVKLTQKMMLTDDNGTAQTFLKVGNITGTYKVVAEISDPKKIYIARGIPYNIISVNKRKMFFDVFGGLAIFIFGMKMMSDSLKRLSAERLRKLLQILTYNRFVAIAAGTIITATIQSSSACTVMIVGFVNAGLLSLRQAIGVVFGANIGTTATAQIIAFKLEQISFPAIIIGLILVLIGKKKHTQFLGNILLGFGFLFMGMTIMESTLKPLKDIPSFVSFFQKFDCTPINSKMPPLTILKTIMIGTFMTMIIQSSSATIGLTIALAGTGLINFYTAVPLVLGDNIGTTITAILASLGGNRSAKQTAFAHSLFNIFGAFYMFILFFVNLKGQPFFLYLVDSITPGNVLSTEPENIERHIAMAHSLFNIFNVLLFLPFIPLMTKVCQLIIPHKKEDSEGELKYLEPHLLDNPAVAINQAIKEIAYTCSLAKKSFNDSLDYFNTLNMKSHNAVSRREEAIDKLQLDITNYLVKLSQQGLSEGESKMLPLLIHQINDAERAGDCIENILELAELKQAKKLSFSENASQEIENLKKYVLDQFEETIHSLQNLDSRAAEIALKLEDKINEYVIECSQNHTYRLESGQCDIRTGMIYLELIGNFEKIGDRLANIAQRARNIILGQF